MLLEKKIIHIRYQQYGDIIQQLGDGNILEVPTIDELKTNKQAKSLISKAYKEVKGLNIENERLPTKTRKLDIIQYFYYISTGYLIDSLREFIFPLKQMTASSLTSWAWVIIDNYDNHKINTRNLLRLFDTCPTFYYILKSLINKDEIDLGRPTKYELIDQLKCTSLLSAFIELLIDEDIFGSDPEIHNEAMSFLISSYGDVNNPSH